MSAPIVQDRVIAAPVEEVFAAWSDPALLGQWMCPEPGFAPATVELDFRVGGGFSIVMHGERDYVQTGEYLEIVPGKRIVMRWVSDFMPIAEARTRVSVSFESAGAGATRLVLVHDELPDSDAYAGHTAGWAHILECARRVLEPRGA